MLEAVFFQAADLLGGGQSLIPAFVQPVQQQGCFAGRFYCIGADALLFQCGGLFGAGGTGFPPKGGHITGQIFGLNAHFVLQRVHQTGALAALFFQLLGKGFLPLGHHIFGGLLGGFLHIFRAGGRCQVVGHLLGHGVVLAHKVSRAAKLVAVGQPEKIQEQQVFFAFEQAGAAAHHLAVQAAYLGGAQHHNAVHTGAVPAFGQQHAVAQHVIGSGIKIRQHLGAVGALAVDLGSRESVAVQGIPEFLACLDQRQKDNGFAVFAVVRHLGRDLVKIRVQGAAQFAHGIVPAGHAHGGDIQPEGDGLRHNAAQKAVPDGIGEFILIGQAVEHLAQVAQVAAVGCGRYAQDFSCGEPVQNAAVAIGNSVVGFVNDDGAEIIMGELFQPLGALQALHAANGNAVPAGQAGLFGFFHRAAQAG